MGLVDSVRLHCARRTRDRPTMGDVGPKHESSNGFPRSAPRLLARPDIHGLVLDSATYILVPHCISGKNGADDDEGTTHQHVPLSDPTCLKRVVGWGSFNYDTWTYIQSN